jgi:hypothetical protein
VKAFACMLMMVPGLAFGQASKAVPNLLPYQGRLLRVDRTPEIGQTTLTFTIYNDSGQAGVALWHEDQSVVLTNGFYAVLLGAAVPLPAVGDSKFFLDGRDLWLGVKVQGDSAELSPRHRLASVAYAVTATNALNAATATHAASADSATTATNASHALGADNATSATKANSADHATSSDSAKNADYATNAGHANTADSASSVTGRVLGGGSLVMNSSQNAFVGCTGWGVFVPATTSSCSSSGGCGDPSCSSGARLILLGHGSCWSSANGFSSYCRNYLCLQ